jgi:tRNA/tmRNA/rRNA uracil-C5-methylase (TrmA/RlmC/RlmD family)
MMSLHYRNKTIFDWKTFQKNNISSLFSLHIMNFLKKNFSDIDIHNVIIRDINSMVSIIIQLNDNLIDNSKKIMIFNIINEYIESQDYDMKYFAIQSLTKRHFEKDKNIIIYKNNYIKFVVKYFYPVIICLLPNSFFQPNIKLLNQYYNKFSQWIQQSECKNMINLGDDGGNICTILNKYFENMISFFHCNSSYKCAEEMIIDNNIHNLLLTYNIGDCVGFDEKYNNTVLFINPGRKGLRNYELEFINNSVNIKYIIYLACNYKAFLKNKIQLDQYKIIDQVELNVMPMTKMTQNLVFMKLDT